MFDPNIFVIHLQNLLWPLCLSVELYQLIHYIHNVTTIEVTSNSNMMVCKIDHGC